MDKVQFFGFVPDTEENLVRLICMKVAALQDLDQKNVVWLSVLVGAGQPLRPPAGWRWGDVDVCAVDDETLSRIRRQKLGHIFQDFNLIPILTAEKNIIMQQLLDGQKSDKTKLWELAEFLGISNRLKRLPGELSGGQKQRVAIDCALISDPVFLLADEPTGNLDKKTADEIMELLLELNRRGNTVLLVTHEQRYADLCGRKTELSDGKIVV